MATSRTTEATSKGSSIWSNRASPNALLLPPASAMARAWRRPGADMKVMPARTTDELRQHQHRQPQRHPALLAVGLLLLLEGPQVEEHDDEHEQHHDGARVHEDLHDGQEVGLGKKEDGGDVDEREHQQQQGVHHVLASDGAEPPATASTANTRKRIFSAMAVSAPRP